MNAVLAHPIAVGWKGLSAGVLLDAGITRSADWTVRIPYRDATGAERNAKIVTPSGKTWWEQAGVDMLPFGVERLAQPGQRDSRLMFIAEGESDALALRDEYAGWRRYPVDIIGLPGAGTWKPEWGVHVAGYLAAYVFPDGDQAGDRMAEKVAMTVRSVIRVRLPAGKDVRSVLQEDGVDVLDECILRGDFAAVMLAGMRRCRGLDELERYLAEVEW